ncbi:MAG: ABC transporter permease [Bryobacteraceae bacterium]
MQANSQLLTDSLASLRVWRVWLFLGKQDIKARFRRSFIGPLWILLNMFLFVAGAGVLYGALIKQPMREFLPYLVAGLALWGAIVASLTESAFSFVNAEGYIKQFCYPKQIYLLRTLVSHTIVLLITLTAVVPVQLFFGGFSILGWLLAVPGLVMLLLASSAHITISGYLGVRFRDFPHAAGGILQVAFFVTPVMFPTKILDDRHLSLIYRVNPFYYLISVARRPIIEGVPAAPETYLWAGVYILAAWTVAALIAKSLDSRIVVLL